MLRGGTWVVGDCVIGAGSGGRWPGRIPSALYHNVVLNDSKVEVALPALFGGTRHLRPGVKRLVVKRRNRQRPGIGVDARAARAKQDRLIPAIAPDVGGQAVIAAAPAFF